MSRRVLLIEPNYRNKYPPLGLMKLATYFRTVCHDDIRFFKGKLKSLGAQLLLEKFFEADEEDLSLFRYNEVAKPEKVFGRYAEILQEFIETGKYSCLEDVPHLRDSGFEDRLMHLRRRYKREDYPKFDIVCVNSLFTFFWAETIETINYAKKFLSKDGKIFVGGVSATLVPKDMRAEVGEGVHIHCGLLDKPNDLGKTGCVCQSVYFLLPL